MVKMHSPHNWWISTNWSKYAPFKFNAPYGIAVSDEQRVYLTHRQLHRVEVYSQFLGSSSQLPQPFGTFGSGADQFNTPHGIDVTRVAGQLYVFIADTLNHRLVRTDADGSNFTAFAMPAETGAIVGVAAHASGNVYCTDSDRGLILHFDVQGNLLGQYSAGERSSPSGIAVDWDGYLYVVDGRWIKKFTPDGQRIARFGYTDSGDPLEEIPPEFLMRPQDVAVDLNKVVYVTDADASRPHIARWEPEGTRDIWVRIPAGAVRGQMVVNAPSGPAQLFYNVFEPGPISVDDAFITQGIAEYPPVERKRTIVLIEMTTPLAIPQLGAADFWGSPVTDTTELVIKMNGGE
jgi:hypothetical protein